MEEPGSGGGDGWSPKLVLARGAGQARWRELQRRLCTLNLQRECFPEPSTVSQALAHLPEPLCAEGDGACSRQKGRRWRRGSWQKHEEHSGGVGMI